MNKVILLIVMILAVTRASYSQDVRFRIPDTTVNQGDTLLLPVYADSSLTGKGYLSYQLQLSIDFSFFQMLGLVTESTISGQFGLPVSNISYNTLSIASAGVYPLTGEGEFIIIRLKVLKSGWTYPGFTGAQNNYFNEGPSHLTFENANVYSEPERTISMYPNSGVYFVGDSVQFSASSSGIEPFFWSVSDSTVARIDSTGKLKGLNYGKVRVFLQDSAGISAQSDGLFEFRSIKVNLRDTSAWQGSRVEIPVYINDISELNILSGNIELVYNSEILLNPEIITSQTILEGGGLEAVFKKDNIKLAFAKGSKFSGSGLFFIMKFDVTKELGYGTNIYISDLMFNENLTAILEDGYFTTKVYSELSLSYVTEDMIAGESRQFAVSNGIEPYRWSISDTSIAGIDQNGLLTAFKGGICQVSVSDSVGSSKSTVPIKIFDTSVWIPDTTSPAGSTIELPVYIDSFPAGQSIYSSEMSLEFDTSDLEFIEVETSGAGFENWTALNNFKDNRLMLVFAGTQGVDNPGVLFRLRFRLKKTFIVGQNTYVNIKNAIFNEGIPDTQTKNGSIRSIFPDDIGITGITISAMSGCEMTSSEIITLIIRNYGHNTYQAGNSIPIEFEINGHAIFDTLLLTGVFSPGDSIGLMLNSSFNISEVGDYYLSASTLMENDADPSNNSFTKYFNNIGLYEINLGNDINACKGELVQLDGGNADHYAWNTSENTQIIEVDTSGVYILNANLDGCMDSDTIKVVFIDLAVVNLGNDTIICENTTLTLDAGIADLYQWSSGDTTKQINIGVEGYYWVKTTSDNCFSYDTILIETSYRPELIFETVDASCGLNDGIIEAIPVDSDNSFLFMWDNDPLKNSSFINNLGIGMHLLEIKDGNCSFDYTIRIEENGGPLMDVNFDTITICLGDTVDLIVSGADFYQWNPDNTLSRNDSSCVNAFPSLSTLYTVYGTSSGCTSIKEIWVEVMDCEYQRDTTKSTICYGDSIFFANNWYSSSGIFPDTTEVIPGYFEIALLDLWVLPEIKTQIDSVLCAGSDYMGFTETGTYELVLVSYSGCDSVVILNLTILQSTEITLVESACETFTLNGETYNASGTYVQHMTSSNGCDSTIILQLSIGTSSIGTDFITSCSSLTWIDGITYTESNNTASFILTNSYGCDSLITLDLTIDPLQAGLIQDNDVLTALPFGADYQWLKCSDNSIIPGATNQSISPVISGKYSVIVMLNNCIDTSECFDYTVTETEQIQPEILMVYPNPVFDYLYIEGIWKDGRVEIHDMTGRRLMSFSNKYSEKMTLNLQNLEPGSYLLNIYHSNGITKMPIQKR